jgi:hypothetical protein
MLFRCKCCPEKDARIADLKEQVSLLRTLIFQQVEAEPGSQELEADALLSGRQHVFEDADDTLPSIPDEASEADRILSGNYS